MAAAATAGHALLLLLLLPPLPPLLLHRHRFYPVLRRGCRRLSIKGSAGRGARGCRASGWDASVWVQVWRHQTWSATWQEQPCFATMDAGAVWSAAAASFATYLGWQGQRTP